MRSIAVGVILLLWSGVASANTRICVSVQQKSWYRAAPHAPPPPPPPAEAAEAPAATPELPPPYKPPVAPRELDATKYLARMLEYEVTHEPGFAAVADQCSQRITVELYQLANGWTVFARYSGTEREEKVDHAELDEFPELAQRIAFALLRGRPINQTITRENVLRADSEGNLRTIDGSNHLLFGMGTAPRVARLPTAQQASEPVVNELRLLTPVSLQIGYRRKLRSWGLDAFGRVILGTENTGAHANDLGGHVDYAGSVQLGMHFLRYADPAGVNSLYYGGGAAFELAVFEAIQPTTATQGSGSRSSMLGGGLNIDLLLGYEFLRASSVHFFAEVDIEAPAYQLKTANDAGAIDTYMPGALAQIGVIF
jgi:hypothetical protein